MLASPAASSFFLVWISTITSFFRFSLILFLPFNCYILWLMQFPIWAQGIKQVTAHSHKPFKQAPLVSAYEIQTGNWLLMYQNMCCCSLIDWWMDGFSHCNSELHKTCDWVTCVLTDVKTFWMWFILRWPCAVDSVSNLRTNYLHVQLPVHKYLNCL